MYSWTLREMIRQFHGVRVGAYSYGDCLFPGCFPPGVTVGRYVSVAAGARAFVRNHPTERLSMHPFFYNPALSVVPGDNVAGGELEIGHDAWLGERAIITPGCRRIGLGAVVGAGSVVTKDVPDFAIVAGNPARLIRYRFPHDVREKIIASRWWEMTIDECRKYVNDMVVPLSGDSPVLFKLPSGQPAPASEGGTT